ncbi:TIGR04168 family protein [Phormidesmis priestleyi ULC007]|uniref:TIGR04168 family protein n=1 Tax=Phormidesmis priestleyi ULC007 TaxID=1920490 RepID=A0A2T1D7A1_9CYAN|nr:TIGR04168 family protein [Phormidesmis priestleyi]PSB16326.1 TIGR04168 family protein [Phormidesmis priestleyi ULC007]PZO46975.1 MAG: TIGR04168 family protein [Phormidesmis priestleyi]
MVSSQGIKIAVVGDIHDLWDHEDEAALKALGVDLVLLVGDFGNESVEVVRSIAQMDLPKAAILGNHDAWYNATDWGIKQCPYDRTQEDRVQQQIDLLGDTNVGYGKLDFPELGLSVVGSRPFSWGGSAWKNNRFYRDRCGVKNFAESVDRIVAAVNTAAYETVIFVGHNGPTGLGDMPEDPCGKDWQPIGGDHGDPDFEQAIAKTRLLGKAIPLVAFGHMHHTLRHTRQQLRRAIHTTSDGTVYLNAARVPRIVQNDGDRLRNFSLVTLQSGRVSAASLVWVNAAFKIVSQTVLYRAESIAESIA